MTLHELVTSWITNLDVPPYYIRLYEAIDYATYITDADDITDPVTPERIMSTWNAIVHDLENTPATVYVCWDDDGTGTINRYNLILLDYGCSSDGIINPDNIVATYPVIERDGIRTMNEEMIHKLAEYQIQGFLIRFLF